jgi:uncharacterized membrane protein SpoIIM required for sporulation
VILDISRFVETERPHWTALEKSLAWLASNPDARLTLQEVENLHTLYQRASADLARVPDGELRRYLEWLVSRAYAEIHEARERKRFRPWRWVTREYPQTFRKHLKAFQLATVLTIGGVAFGALALRIDSEAKGVIMPFEHLQGSPSDRVAKERRDRGQGLAGHKDTFSASLMTHNTQVAIFTLALGMTFGFGTIVELFYNGVILGAVGYDYVHDGQGVFLLGWLLPHGVIEIPAILVGGQAGFVIAYALIGWGSRISRAERLRSVSRDVVTLAGGAAMMLVWAGFVESFLSQYHEPVISYGTKITFGLVEAALLTFYLGFAGKKTDGHA